MATARKRGEPHPDFVRAIGHRWTGKLPALAKHIRAEAWKLRGAKSAWYVLFHGACVSCRLLLGEGEPRYEMRISRSERPMVGNIRKWEAELVIFVRDLELDGWERDHDAAAKGIAALYTEPTRRG